MLIQFQEQIECRSKYGSKDGFKMMGAGTGASVNVVVRVEIHAVAGAEMIVAAEAACYGST